MATCAAIMVNGFDFLIENTTTSYEPGVISGGLLRDPNTLLGAEIKLSDERYALLGKSSLRLGATNESLGNDTWYPVCTATKAQAPDGRQFVVTAGHCISTVQRPASGPQANAKNVTADLINSYALFSRDAQPLTRDGPLPEEPVAFVREVAKGWHKESDIAVLEVGKSTDRFNAMPALAMDGYANSLSDIPVAGQPVALFSFPVSAQRPVETKGTYLGRVELTDTEFGDTYDMVGADLDTYGGNPCDHAASGSSALFEDGTTGPLTYSYAAPDVENIDSQKYRVRRRLETERKLNLNTDGFDVVCAFTSLPNADTMGQLVQAVTTPRSIHDSPSTK